MGLKLSVIFNIIIKIKLSLSLLEKFDDAVFDFSGL